MEEESVLDSSLLDELWGTVSDELAELGEEMESALLALESDPGDSGVINSLFRAMHTYKSSAGMMGCSVTEALAHRSEDLVDYFRGKEEPLPEPVVELMFQTVDLLATMREHVTEERTDAPASLTRELVEKLSSALAGAGGEVVVAVPDSSFEESSLGLAPEEFAELWGTVSDEMEELLYDIEETLLALESAPTDGDLISKLFRSMHTFKSSSGMMGLTVMEQIAHRSEDLVDLLRNQGLALSEENASLLLNALDRLRELHQLANETNGDGKLGDSIDLINKLVAAHGRDSGEVVTGSSQGDENGFGFFAPEEPAEEDGFGFFEPDEPEGEEDGFGFFDMDAPIEEGDEEDGFGFFDIEAPEKEGDGFGFFEDDQKDLWELTVDETRDNLDDIEAALLELEHDASSFEQLDRLFRAIHTIKGTANVMGLMRIEKLAHRSEDLVGLARDRTIDITPPLVTLLLEAMDLIRVGLETILQTKSDLAEAQIAPLIVKLQRFLDNPHAEAEEVVEEEQPAAEEAHAAEEGDEEMEDPSKDPLYVQIFVEMGWEVLERLNGIVEQLAGDATDELYEQLSVELEDLFFAAERMGYNELCSHFEKMRGEKDPMVLNEGVGWIGGQLTELEELLGSGQLATSESAASPEPVVPPMEPLDTMPQVASDDDFFGGNDPFDEVADQLPHVPTGGDIYEPSGDDEVDPVFTPVFVQDFLEKEEEQLMGLRSIWDQTDLSERERTSKMIHLLKEIEVDARKMGYDHLIEIIEQGCGDLDRARGGEALESGLEQLELKLYEELTAIQEAIPDLNSTASGAPIDISWVFRQSHAEHVYEELAELSDLLDQFEEIHTQKNSKKQTELEIQAEKHLRSIHHSAIFYEMTAAAGLALSLADFYSRITQHELNTSNALIALTRDFVSELGVAIDGVRDGMSANSGVFETMMSQVEDLLYMNSGSTLIKSARDVLALLDLPEDFFEVFTPDSLHAVGEALEKGFHFYIVHTDMDQNEEIALGFYRWSQSEDIEIITNFTVLKEGRSLFDFLVASPREAADIQRDLVNIDPTGVLLKLRDSALRSDLEGITASDGADGQGKYVSSGNFSTDELMETVGDLVSVQAMLHHVTSSFSKMDFLNLFDQEMKRSEGDWKQARAAIQAEMELWKRHNVVLGQLENEVGVSVGRLQELVHQADAISAGQLFSGLDEWLGDESAQQKKSVRFAITGGDLEVERGLLVKLEEPLKALMTASLYSIESVVERMERGKSSIAELQVSLHKSHDFFELSIEDDGLGFDQGALAEQLGRWQKRGSSKQLSDAVECMQQDGFGVVQFHDGQSGFDFAQLRKQLEPMGGHLRIQELGTGQGLRLRVLVPLSMAVINGLVIRIGEVRYVVPVNFVRRIVQARADQLVYASADGGQEMLHLDGQLIPLKMLAGMELNEHGERHLMVVVEVGEDGEQVACPVDELIDQQQVMIRPLKGVLTDVRDASGIAVLGDGEVGVVLRLDSIH